MQTVTLIGYLATVCSMSSFTPQAWKIIRTRETNGVCLLLSAFILTMTVLPQAEKDAVAKAFDPDD
ncbi:PQ-loop repeat-containing protein [Mesorhizobium sp. M0058]|uniref:PQ-loop repeat-containing protein n=1 Tax=Mesorhizobium sp. M0058 TaxID=2956865 RepID=UPI00333AC670